MSWMRERGAVGATVAAIVGAALVAGAARLTFALPGTDLPQSGQTLAVLLVGAALGFRRGVLAIVVYLGAAAVGVPVLADGASGVDAMLGPSAGYLLGFLFAAAWVGWAADRDGFVRPWSRILLLMLGAHACLLLLGGGLLIPRIGLARAWSAGVAPFVAGGVVKSLFATAVVYVVRGRLRGRSNEPLPGGLVLIRRPPSDSSYKTVETGR